MGIIYHYFTSSKILDYHTTKRPVKRSKRLLSREIILLVTTSPLDTLSMVVRDLFITGGLQIFSGP